LLVLKALTLIQEEKTVNEVTAKIKESINLAKTVCFIAEPKWLEASGRVSPIIASWLKRSAKIGIK